MSHTLVVFAVFLLIISTALIASIPIRVNSQLPFIPSSPSFPSESTDNNVSGGATASKTRSSATNTNGPEHQQIEQIKGFSTYEILLFSNKLIGSRCD